ncbi:hypothetical protein EMMF5_005192 [Cystobasidiomycetes sp. EMM_F5]
MNGNGNHPAAYAHGKGQMLCVEDVEMNNRVRRKLDYAIMPCLVSAETGHVSLVANYVDRNNMAAARLKGLQTDLNLSSIEYSNALSLFFVTYVGLQPFATNLLAYVTKPTYFICGCMVVWGIISLCTGFVHNYSQILAVRLLLGVAEAVFYVSNHPGALFTLSKFYTRSEIGKRAAWFYSASLVATGFGSLFAAGVIGGLNGVNGTAGWRYLFFVEGAITVGAAVVIALILPNFPHNAYFLTAEERLFAVRRVTEDLGQVDQDDREKWTTSLLVNLTNPTTYLICNLTVLNAPPYVLALICANLNAWHSDKTRDRSYHILAFCLVAIVGCIILLATTNQAARFVGIFLMTAGYGFPGKPKRRAATIGWLAAFANSANLAGGYFFVSDIYGPTYRGSFGIVLAMFVATIVMLLATRFWLAYRNRQLARLEEKLLAGETQVADNKLLQETADQEGVDKLEAAKMAAAYRFYL